MRRRQDLGPPMSMAAFIRGFAFLVMLILALLALAWAAMSWALGDRAPAIIVMFLLPIVLVVLYRLGRSMPGLRG